VSLYERIGEEKLRALVVDFYDRVFADAMIGFLFVGKNRPRLIEKEFEFAAALLGAKIRYTGRSIKSAHAKVPVLGGHFDRRMQILKDTLADHAVDSEVQKKWLDHSSSLRALVTADAGSDCDHELAAQRLAGAGVDPESGDSTP